MKIQEGITVILALQVRITVPVPLINYKCGNYYACCFMINIQAPRTLKYSL